MANRDFYVSVDLHNQSLQNALLNPMTTDEIIALATTLAAAQQGYVTYDIDRKMFLLWNGTEFDIVRGNTTFFQADTTTFPTASAGDRLIVTDTGTDTGLVLEEWLYSGANWVDVSATAVTGRLVVYNPSTTDTLLKGRGVHLSGSQGTHPNAYYASAISESESMLAGILLDDIPPESTGYMLPYGMATNIPVEFGTDGDLSFLAASNPADGTFSTTETSFPNHRVVAGIIIRAHATNGRFLVKIEGGYEVEELHDVDATGVADGDILVHESDGAWRARGYIGDMSLLGGPTTTLTLPTLMGDAPLQSEIGSTYSYAQYPFAAMPGNFLLYRINMSNGDVSNMFVSATDNWESRASITTWDNNNPGAALVGSETPSWEGSLIITVGSTNLVAEILANRGDINNRSWIYYASQWDVPPVVIGTATSPVPGKVREYTLDTTVRYRLTPTTYSSAQDAFYTTFSDGICSGLIISRT